VADPLDILTLVEAKAALRQGDATANDTEIELLVTATSTVIDRGVGPVVRRTVNAETHDGEGHMTQLREWPVTTVTTVTEDGITLPTTAYHVDLEKGQVWRRLSDWDYPWEIGRDNISVTYVAGRFATTASITPFYKAGARLLLRHLWRSEQWNAMGIGPQEYDVPQVAFPTFAIPKAVADWFGPSWRLSGRDPSKPRGGFV
jgi:hypothetical protein